MGTGTVIAGCISEEETTFFMHKIYLGEVKQ